MPNPVKFSTPIKFLLTKSSLSDVRLKGRFLTSDSKNVVKITSADWDNTNNSDVSIVGGEDTGDSVVKYDTWYNVKHNTSGRYLSMNKLMWGIDVQKVKFVLSMDSYRQSWMASSKITNPELYMMYGDVFSIVMQDGKTTFGCFTNSDICISSRVIPVARGLFQVLYNDSGDYSKSMYNDNKCFGTNDTVCNVNDINLCFNNRQWMECSSSTKKWSCGTPPPPPASSIPWKPIGPIPPKPPNPSSIPWKPIGPSPPVLPLKPIGPSPDPDPDPNPTPPTPSVPTSINKYYTWLFIVFSLVSVCLIVFIHLMKNKSVSVTRQL